MSTLLQHGANPDTVKHSLPSSTHLNILTILNLFLLSFSERSFLRLAPVVSYCWSPAILLPWLWVAAAPSPSSSPTLYLFRQDLVKTQPWLAWPPCPSTHRAPPYSVSTASTASAFLTFLASSINVKCHGSEDVLYFLPWIRAGTAHSEYLIITWCV